MKRIEWDDERCSVGDARLDKQHRQIIVLVNEMIDVATAGGSKGELLRLLMVVMNASERHFAMEESLLERVHYPGIDQQREEHNRYNESLSGLMCSIDSGAISHAIGFLAEWWREHIFEEDMAYASYLSK